MKRTIQIGLILILCLLLVASFALLAACDKQPVLQLKNEDNVVRLDLDDGSIQVDIASFFKEKISDVDYRVSTDDAQLTLSAVADGKFTISSQTAGSYTVHVECTGGGNTLLEFDITVNVTGSDVGVTVKKATDSVSVEEIMFPGATTYVRYIIDPSAYFDADASITYSAECLDDGVAFTESAGKIIAECTDFGEKNITLYALEGDQRVASAVITLGVLPKYPTQLTNGDFEHGDYYGWQLTDEEKEAYSLYTNSVDIWNNPNNSTGTQLYGYAQEAFANADFVSSLFKVDGTGVITWKMGGNCTEQLQFKLMMYVEDGDDVEIAKFNNWYFGDKRGSAFIMRSYYYQIDEQYLGKYFYFEVIDNASSGEFAFICLDDIVTYYAEAPDFEGCYVASYLTPPPALTLANATNKVMTETSVPKVEVDLAELFTAPIDSSLKFSATCDSDKVTASDIENNKFTLTCSVEGSYTVHVVAEYNNIAILRFDIAFDVVAAVQDPTAKSKTATVTADTVFYADGTMEGTAQKDIADLFDAVEAITYSAECADPSVSVNIVNKKIVFKSTTAGNKQVTVNALKFGNVAATVQLTVKVATAPSAQLLNGDFEHGDYYGWQLTDEEKEAYSLYNNSVDIWNNPNNSTGTQLYGYAQEAFAEADFVSSLFKADGTGVITWKMGGNCTEQLQFKLMMYVEGGENVEIAKFNNWYFGAYKGSAFIMRSYYYQIDKQYLGRYFYFEVIDNASSGEFAFICLDDIVTYYAAAPDFEGCYVASYLTPPPTLTLVNETNNVMTETSVPEVEVDLSELFTAPIDASLKFEASCEDDKVAVSKVTDNKFTLTCSVEGNYTVQVVAKYNNIEIFRFDVAFEVVAAVQDPTAKSDTATVTAETVFYRDGTMEGTAQKDIADLFDAVEAITYSVSCEDQSVSVEIVNKKIVFKSTTSGDKQVTVNALKFGKVAATVQLTVKVATEPSTQLLNGDFEHGDYYGWQLTDEEKAAYSLYTNSVDIWNNPNNSTGTQLYGYAQEAFANADFVSSLFKADGTGIITWKMGGNCTEQLQFKLMMYVEGGDDVEIAKFNNWYFGAKAGSAFIMRSYYYQIEEQYIGRSFYFEVIDNASSGAFAFICLDDIVTYYAETPALENFYLASYLTPPIVNSEKAIVTAETVFYRDGTMEGIAQKAISDLFNVADDEITFSVNCEDGSVSVEIVDKKIVFKSTTSGDKQVTVNALRSDSVVATVQLTVKVAAEPSTQLFNGNFEHGDYFGWQLTEEEKAAYSLYNNSVDIWNNPNNSTGTQLYGYAQEAFANADFVSSLFKVDGTGVITWKMGGNCTEQLQFKLMMYVEDGDDVEIAKFNNWYYGAKAGSAFIMRSYYYQIDEQYLGEYFYFEVIDNASGGGFAFICLDDIVTYYAETPQFGNDWYKAGYCTDPDQN